MYLALKILHLLLPLSQLRTMRHWHLKKTFVILLCSYSFAAFGFLNIESLRQRNPSQGVLGKPGKNLLGSFGLRLNDQKGNVNKSLFQVDTLNMMTNGQSNYILLANYRYGESFEREDTRQGNLHLRYTRVLSTLFSAEFYQQTEFNKFEDLSLRVLGGGGLRAGLIKEKKNSLFIGLGAFYEKEDLEGDLDPENPRGNLYLSYLYKGGLFDVSSTFYYQPNLEEFADARVRFNIGLETKLNQYFSQTLEYTIRRDSRPPIGILRTDSQVLAGLRMRY